MNSNISDPKICLYIIEKTKILSNICIICQQSIREKYFTKLHLTFDHNSNSINAFNKNNLDKEIENDLKKAMTENCNH